MPQIPIYNQRTNATGNLGPGPESVRQPGTNALSILGAGLESVANDQFKLKQFAQLKQDEKDTVAANSTLMNMRSHWVTELQNRKLSAPADANGFTPQVLADFDTDAKQQLEAVKNPKARNYLQEKLDVVRLGMQDDALQFEAQRTHDYKVTGLGNANDAGRTAAQFRPDDFATIAAEQKLAIDNSGLDEPTKAKLLHTSTTSLAASAVQGLIQRDPYSTLKDLNNEHSQTLSVAALDPDDRNRLRNAAESEIRQREALANQQRAQNHQALNDRVADAQAAYLAGIDVPNPPTRQDFLTAYDPKDAAEANRHYNAFAAIQQVGGDMKSLPLMTPEQQAQLVEQRRPKQVEGASDALKAWSVLAQRTGELNKELKNDPAGYALKYSPSVGTAWNAFSKSPDAQSAQAYAQASVSAQHSLGVNQPNLLTDAAAHAMSDRLQPSGTVSAIQQEAAIWGSYWPQVLAEASPKLNPVVQVIALGMDPVPAQRLASIAALKPEEFAKILPDETKESDVKQAVQGKLAPFSETLLGQAGAEDQLTRLNDAAVKLASSYAAGGEKPEKAAQRAAEEVVLSRYDFKNFRGNPLRIPKGLDDELITTSLRAVDIQVIRTLGLNRSDVRWRTLPDDSGVVLEDRASNRPIAYSDGTPVISSFENLARQAVNTQQDIRELDREMRSMRNLPGEAP